jgi:hypothetical protein
MDLWQDMYANADAELKKILEESNFNPCRELPDDKKILHEGYRIDLIYTIPNAHDRAMSMKKDYDALGYKYCAILSPAEVMAIDPFLSQFCKDHSIKNKNGDLQWDNDTVALWRPGGCIDAQAFLPQLYDYLRKKMGTYPDANGNTQDCFQINFGAKIIGLDYAHNEMNEPYITGMKMIKELNTYILIQKQSMYYALVKLSELLKI